MSRPKSPSLPNTPSLYQNPYVNQSISGLYGYGQGLLSPTVEGLPSILRDTVSTNPEVTRLTLQGLEAQLAGPLQRNRQDTLNQLEANNQLTGSTTASALGQIDQNYTNQLTAAGAQAGIADINRALQNRVSLYGTGLNTLQAAGQLGLGEQSQINQFNLENYQNQVAKVFAEQKQNRGGFMGALTGGLGGAAAGFALGGPIGAGIGALGGGLAGGFGPSGTGGSFLTAGAGLAGQKVGGNYSAGTNTGSIYRGGEEINNLLNQKNPYSFGLVGAY